MLTRFAFILTLSVAAMAPAFAGQITTVDGKTVWAPTQCKEPAEPASLASPAETPANSMNGRIVAYDNYVKAANAYTNCLVNEATHDSVIGGQSVSDQAQAMIDAEQNKVAMLHSSLSASLK